MAKWDGNRKFQMLSRSEEDEGEWMETNLAFPADLASSPDPSSCDLDLAVMRADAA